MEGGVDTSLGQRRAARGLLPLVADLQLAQPLPQLVALLFALFLSATTRSVTRGPLVAIAYTHL